MAFLPLVLLLSAAIFSGAAVSCYVLAYRANRQGNNTIFPVVKEDEAFKAKWAQFGVNTTSILAALTIGGWFATQGNMSPALVTRLAAQQLPTVPAFDLPDLPELSLPVASLDWMPDIQSVASVASVASNDVAQSEPAQSTAELHKLFDEIPTEGDPVPSLAETDLDVDSNPADISSDTSQAVVATEVDVLQPLPDSNTVSASLTAPSDTDSLPAEIPAETSADVAAPAVIFPAVTPTPSPLARQVKIGPIVFSTQVTDHRNAVNPSDIFDTGTNRIYAVFPYNGMRNGMNVSIIWYYQGQEISRNDTTWNWGQADRSYAFIRPRGTGNYQIEMQVNSETLASADFEVR